jgi:glycosyltransferase involved in cell wall biosynthesis
MTKSQKPLKISFCTTCKGRLDHLKETLPLNLARTSSYLNAEHVILAYGDKETFDYIKKNYLKEIKEGRIRLVYSEQPNWQMSHAKNMAHRMATGDVVVNMDADNFMENGFAEWLNKVFNKNPHRVVIAGMKDSLTAAYIHKKPLKDIRGRLAVLKSDFDRLHGYNEKFVAWGGDDDDLLTRSTLTGAQWVSLPAKLFADVLPHDNKRRYENMASEAMEKSKKSLENVDNNPPFPLSLLHKPRVVIGNFAEFVNKVPPYMIERVEPANPDGGFGCGEVTILNRDGVTTRTETLDKMPHPEWVAEYKTAGHAARQQQRKEQDTKAHRV